MNKEALINKLSEVLGTSAKEVKIAYDIFLQKITETLNENETVKIPELGIFRIQKNSGELKKIISIDSDIEKDAYFLLFYPNETGEVIPYYINYHKKSEAEIINSAFNLSGAKQLIPVSEEGKKELLVQSSYINLQKNLEDKIEQLFENSMKLENFGLNFQQGKSEEEKSFAGDFEITEDDFVNDEKFKVEENINDEEIPWDFTPKFEDENLNESEVENSATEEISFDEKSFEENPLEIESDEIISDENDIVTKENPLDEINQEISSESDDDNFIEIDESELFKDEDETPVNIDSNDDLDIELPEIDLSEFENENQNDEIISGDFMQTEIQDEEISGEDLSENISDEIDQDEFQSVENENTEDQIYPGQITINDVDENENEIEDEPVLEESLIDENINSEEEQTSKTISSKKKYKFLEDIEDVEEKVKYPSWFGIVLAAFILFTAAGIYYFFFYQNSRVSAAKPGPQIIERSYDIPVSVIPQDENSTDEIAAAENEIYENANEQTQQSQVQPENENIPEPVKETPAAVQAQSSNAQSNEIQIRNDNKNDLVRDNIFSDGKNYTVQLSSWQSRSKAEGEVRRLRSSGYDSYLTSVNRNDGTWYRVRIGNFGSVEEAQAQLNKVK